MRTGDTVRVNARTVELPNIPSGSTATEVLVWNVGNVEHRSASGLMRRLCMDADGVTASSAWDGSSGNFLGTTNARPLVMGRSSSSGCALRRRRGMWALGTFTPGARLHVVGTGRFDGQLTVTAGGAAITGNSTVTGTLTVSSDVSVGGNLAVAGNTTLGDAAGDTVRVNARTVELPNIPSGSTATEVLVWNVGNVEHRSASGLIGDFAWMLTGNSITSAWNGSSGNFLGTTNARPLVIATTDTTTPQPIQFWTRNVERVRITATGDVGIGTFTPGARLHVVGTGRFDGQLTVTAGGAAITGNSTVTGTLTVSSDVSVGGNLAVAGNTTLGDAAGDTVRVNARTVELPNIPSGSTATEVLVWNVGNVEHRSASGLIGDFAWMLTGNSITSAWNGSSGNFLGTTNARPLVIATTDTTTPQPIQFWTRNVERMRITEAGEVVVQNRAPNGATKVIIQAGANQGTENLLEWRDNSGDTLGVIDANGLVGIGTPRPVRRLHVEGNGSVSAVFVNGGVGIGTVNPLATLHVYDEGLTGATQVVIQSGANQLGVDLLQWRNNSGDTLGVIRPEGSVVLFYDPPARQAFFAVADPSGVPLIGIGPDPTGWGVGVYDDLTGQLRAGMGKVGTQWRMGVGDVGAQNGVLLNWETTNTDNEPRIVVANGSLATPVFLVDREGDVTVAGNTTLGDAAGDTVRVNARTVELPNIPSGSTATEVLVWKSSDSTVERRAASGLISGFAWMLTGNSITSAWNGSSGNFLGTTNARPLVIATTDTTTPQPIQFWTRNVERVRITATGDVGIGTFTPGARLHVVGTGRFDGQLTVTAGGAAITGNSTVTGTLTVSSDVSVGGNLAVAGNTTLGDAAGDTVRVNARTVELPNIPSGSTATEVLVWKSSDSTVERRAASGLISGFAWMLTGNSITSAWNGSSGNFLGTTNARPLVIATTDTTTPQPIQFWTRNVERMRITEAGEVVVQNRAPNGATKVIIQAGANQGTENLLQWSDTTGNVLGRIDYAGNLFVNTNTTLGDAAGDTVRVNARTVELPNIPSGSTATEVLVWKSSDSTVERRAASGLISGFAWMLTGNSITSAWNGSSGNFLGTTNARPLVIATTDTTTPQPIQFWTRNVERMRITEAGEVVVQNQAPNGATKVIIQAGANQGTENLLEWRDNSGDTLGVIDANGLVGIGTTAPVRRLHVVGNGTVSAVFVEGGVGVGTVNPLATLHVYDEGLTGATQVIIQAGANQGTVNLLEWQDSTGTILGVIDADGRVGIGTSSPAATLHIYDERTDPGTGATQVIIQAGANQGTVNLLEWRNNSGDTLGVIDANGLVGIGTTSPVRRLHVVGNGTVSAVFVEGGVGVGTVNPFATLHVYDEGLTGATKVIIQAGANQGTENLLQWSDTTGNVLGRIDYAGNLFVNTNTTLGDAAGDTVRVNARTVELPNIPSGSTATEVLVWKSSDSTVERRAASGLISGFAWMLTGNSITSAWNGSSGNFLGTTNARPLVIATTDTTTPQPIQFWTRNVERMRITEAGEVVVQNRAPNGATKVIIQAGANQGTENLLQWSDTTGNVLGRIDYAGNLFVNTNTTLGDAAGDTVRVNARTVELPNIPSGSTATEVLVWKSSDSTVERRAASGLISGFAWMLTGNSITSAWNGSSGNFLGTTNARPLVIATTDTTTPQPIQFWTRNVERMRITEAGEVVVQNQAPNGATKVIIQAGANQGTENLLEWRDNSGDTLGVIDANGLVGIGTTAPVRRLHVVGNGTVSAVFVEGGVGVGTVNPLATLHVYDEGLTGATQVIIQAGANQGTVNLLEWQDSTGTILGVIDADGRVGIGTSSPAATLHIYDERTDPGTGATQVIIQAGANQGTVNLLEWRNNSGDTLGVIDANGLVGIGTTAPVRRLHVVGNGSVSAVFVEGGVGVGTVNPLATLHVYDEGLTGATQVIIQAGANQGTVNLLEWQDSTGTILGVIDADGRVGIGTSSPAATLHIYDERTDPGTGVTQVIIQAGANQGTVNLLEWRNNSGDTLGVIDANGLVGIGTTAPVRRLHVVGNGSVSAVFVEGGVGVGTVNPFATLHVYDEGLTGATQVIIQAGANQGTVNLLEWQDSTGTILGVIDADGRVGIGTSSPAATLHIYDERTDPGTGATQVIIQAGANQGTVNLLEWRNNSGDTLGVIDANGLVGIGTTSPVRRLHVVGNGTVSAVFVEGGVGVGTVNPFATLHVYDEGLTGATKVIIQAGANQGTENLLQWSDTTGNVLGRIDYAGNLFVNTNTTLGDAAGDTVRVNARTVELPNIPSGSTATEVLVWKSSDSTVERRAASGLISGFAWMLTGNSITSAWNGSSGNFLGTTNARPLVIATTDTTTPQPIQFWTRNVERMRITEAGEVVVQNRAPNGATKVIIQAGANQGTENLLQWSDTTGNVLGRIDYAGNLFVNTNTTLGDAAGDTVRVNARTVELPNIPSGSTATEVLVWKSSDSTVEHRCGVGAHQRLCMDADGQQHYIGMERFEWELPWDDERAAVGDSDDGHNDAAADPVLDQERRADADYGGGGGSGAEPGAEWGNEGHHSGRGKPGNGEPAGVAG
jgi:adenylosuccinate synthase